MKQEDFYFLLELYIRIKTSVGVGKYVLITKVWGLEWNPGVFSSFKSGSIDAEAAISGH